MTSENHFSVDPAAPLDVEKFVNVSVVILLWLMAD